MLTLKDLIVQFPPPADVGVSSVFSDALDMAREKAITYDQYQQLLGGLQALIRLRDILSEHAPAVIFDNGDILNIDDKVASIIAADKRTNDELYHARQREARLHDEISLLRQAILGALTSLTVLDDLSLTHSQKSGALRLIAAQLKRIINDPTRADDIPF